LLTLGGVSYHGASSGAAYGQTGCGDVVFGSGGGGQNGGAGGAYIGIQVGTVSHYIHTHCVLWLANAYRENKKCSGP